MTTESGMFERGLDVACGDMRTAPMFKTKSYTGIDIDKDKLELAEKRTGNKGRVCSIEDMDPSITGDFVVCLQTVGFNALFDTNNTLLAVRQCIRATSQGGTLLMNIGLKSREYHPEVKEYVKEYFDQVEFRQYGRFFAKRHGLISLLLAKLMYFFPFLAKSSRTPYLLMICRQRNKASV